MAHVARTIGMVLDSKGHEVYSVKPDTSVLDALRLMADKGIGAVLVLKEDGGIAGIMSERDYARKITLKGKTAAETLVSEIMTKDVITVSPEQKIEECMTVMVDKRIRHLPVLDTGKLIGILSIGDVVKEMISEQKFLIEQLETYIRGY
jgi:CBS domain-containing protein